MKRNKVTLVWLLAVIVVMLLMWIIPMQFKPVQVASQGDATEEGIMEWERADFVLQPKDNSDEGVRINYQDDDFTHLLTDYNTTSWFTQSIYNEVYSHFPIFDRPNLREYAVMNASDSRQLWYQSPYLQDRDEDNFTFNYTIVDTEDSSYIEESYTFEDEAVSFFDYLSYAEDEENYYILLEISKEEVEETTIVQLTIDKISGEMVQEETVDYDGEQAYALSPHLQNKAPGTHVMYLGVEYRGESTMYSGSFGYPTGDALLVIDPITLDATQVEIPSSDEAEDSDGVITAMALITGENLYFLSNVQDYSEEEEIVSNDLMVYQYDWGEEEFTQAWDKELEEMSTYTVQFSELYLGIVEDESQARIEKLNLDTGEVEETKEFVSKEGLNYDIRSLEFISLN